MKKMDYQERKKTKSRARALPIEAKPGWSDWSQPIEVAIGPHTKEIITNPGDALSFMVNRWRLEQGAEYFEARHLASEFLRRRTTKEAVHRAFLNAVERAYLVRLPSIAFDAGIVELPTEHAERQWIGGKS